MKYFLSGFALVIAVGMLGLYYAHQVKNPQGITLGAFGPTGGGTYRLGQSIGTSNTTIKLSSFKEPVSNIPYTMSYLNSDIEYGTLSPQSSISEFISFTGISQNGDGSATLTGVTRGLTRTPAGIGCTASTTLAQSHAGQSIFIVSNSPCFYAEYLPARTTATSSAVLTFGSTTPPRLDNDAIHRSGTYIATTSEFATYSLVAAVANAGTVNATAAAKGTVQLPTARQAASSTLLGSTGASLALQTAIATDTPQNCTIAGSLLGGCVVMSALDGFIRQSWLDLTKQWSFSNVVATYLFGTNASSTNATTTNLTVTGHSLGITKKVGLSTTATSITLSTATTSIFSFTVEPGSLSTTNFIKATIYVRGFHMDTTQCAQLAVEAGYGYASSTALLNFTPSKMIGGSGTIDLLLGAAGATNSQKLTVMLLTAATSSPTNLFGYVPAAATTSVSELKTTSLAVDSTAAQNLGVNVKLSASNAECWFQTDQATAELYQ